MKFTKAIFSAGFLMLAAVACEHDEPAPAVDPGECFFVRRGYDTEADAQKRLDDILKYLEEKGTADVRVEIVDSKTYVSHSKGPKRKAKYYGLQVVFRCDQAGLINERVNVDGSEVVRDNAYKAFVATLIPENGFIFYEGTTGSDSSNCTDGDGNNYSCGPYTYWYEVTYFKINSSAGQKQMLEFVNQLKAKLPDPIASRLTVADTLKVASYIPGSIGKEAGAYYELLQGFKHRFKRF
jgi:hypothetical protein